MISLLTFPLTMSRMQRVLTEDLSAMVCSREWDGWMASPTQWTWVWARSRSWWWTGKPDMLQSMGSQRVQHDWVTELKWTDLIPAKTWRLTIIVIAKLFSSVQFSSVAQSCLTLWPHESQHARHLYPSQTPGFTQTHVHQVGDAIQPSHPLPSPSPPAPNPSQQQGLFQ